MRRFLTHAHYVVAGWPADRPRPPLVNVAYLDFTYLPPPKLTIYNLDPRTEEGRIVCQQVMLDMAYFWLGKPVEFLALYQRDWL